ncbi:MAG: GTPase ObgE [archaeon]
MIDEASFVVKAGNGGDGQVGFRREKNRPKCGPDGGNGGQGGSIYVETTTNLNTLSDLFGRHLIVAKNGANGKNGRAYAKRTEDTTLQIPVGTMIYNADTGRLIVDLDKPGMRFCLARGGKGGTGNWCFRSSTNVYPKESTEGEKTKPISVQLKLKVLAQIGLAGLPNAGKSTLLSVLTKAKPKIANYPFTTLSPNLGVMETDDKKGNLVIADIPGLIEDASLGKGLGIQFLQHLQRCQLIVYVLYPEEDVLELAGKKLTQHLWAQKGVLEKEMAQFSNDLLKVSSMIVINKTDLLSQEQQDAILSFFKTKKEKVLLISAITKDKVQTLSYELQENYKKAMAPKADGAAGSL